MDKHYITKVINEILLDITRLSNALYALGSTDIQRYPDNYEVLSTEAALKSEKITCLIRHLVYSTTEVNNAEYLVLAGTAHGLEIDYRGGVVEITLPCLLPKRKQFKMEFILDPFRYTLSKFAESNTIPRFEHCVVCFSHIYSRSLSVRRIRDYDNLELKKLLDIISTFILVDDTGLLCDAYNTTELGEKDCTRIYIMDKTRFPKWLSEKGEDIKKVIDL